MSYFADSETEDGVSFEKILYEGVIEEGVVRHETITVLGYGGTHIQILGGNTFLSCLTI